MLVSASLSISSAYRIRLIVAALPWPDGEPGGPSKSGEGTGGGGQGGQQDEGVRARHAPDDPTPETANNNFVIDHEVDT
jgi:hypothetical protein